jgi:hypothetical protein
LSSFLIDFDHYVCAVKKTGKFSFSSALNYHKELGKKINNDKKKGVRKKYDFHLFHTLEFHLLIGILGIFWPAFFFIFIGMVFHSMLDIFYGIQKDVLHTREFFFFNWLRKK